MRYSTRNPYLSRRSVIKGVGAAGLAAGLGLHRRSGPVTARQTEPTTDISGTRLRILQWAHFVPRYDAWFDPFAQEWGEANGVEVQVDHVGTAEIPGAIAAEISAGEGHDLVEHISPLANLEPSLLDLTDLFEEINNRHGEPDALSSNSTYNPSTGHVFGICHGWAPDPGNYRRSLWEQMDMPDGPTTWQDLIDVGSRIRDELEVQMGIGMSNEIDSNMAALALIWSFGGSVQDESENVIINSPETIAAVEYMTELYQAAMTPEVFGWNAASNNQLLIAGQASYILNSISAYRTAQVQNPEVAEDVFFTPALLGPTGEGFVNGHAIMQYMIPNHAQYPDTAKEFILHLINNYDQAVMESELYHFASWPSTAPEIDDALNNDPYDSVPPDKLNVLANARDWTQHVGWPGPTNAVLGDVFGQYILPQMMAKAAQGELSPADAVAEAEGFIQESFEQWARQGLVGGGR